MTILVFLITNIKIFNKVHNFISIDRTKFHCTDENIRVTVLGGSKSRSRSRSINVRKKQTIRNKSRKDYITIGGSFIVGVVCSSIFIKEALFSRFHHTSRQ